MTHPDTTKPESETKSNEGGSRSTRRIELVADRIDSRDLFLGTREVTIGHGADTYRLRLTSQNKLILTK